MKKAMFLLALWMHFFSALNAVDMVSIKGGWFEMGDDKTEMSPKHDVYVSSFEISPVEVTYGLYRQFLLDKSDILDKYDVGMLDDTRCADELGYFPPKFHYNEQWPVIRVSFYTALLFCNWLSEKEGFTPCYEVNGQDRNTSVKWNKEADGYRLPTEAEWEYAAGCGGTDLRMYDCSLENLKRIANFWYIRYRENGEGIYNDELLPVASKEPNKWGIYDMLGNVWEWCWDYNNYYPETNINPARDDTALVDETHLEFGKYNGIQDRIRRGGCKSDRVANEKIEDISVTYRSHHDPWLRTYGTTGMRVARNAPDSTVFTAYVNDNRVRIRQSPGLNGKILTAFDTGTVLEIISEKKLSEKEEYPWYQVRTKTNVIGWMYGEFVSERKTGD